MNKLPLAFFAAAVCLAGCSASPSASVESSKTPESSTASASEGKGSLPIKFAANFAEAKKEAEATGKTILVKFTAEWCGPCKQMKAQAFTDQSVADILVNTVSVEIDIDTTKEKEIEEKYYDGQGIPYVALVKADGSLIKGERGYGGVPAFKDWLASNLPKG